MWDFTLFKHIILQHDEAPLALHCTLSSTGILLLLLHCLLYTFQFHRNRLSKFEYYEGDPGATRSSEEVLLQSTERPRYYHNGGWLGFKPSSDYAIEVSFRTNG